MKRNSFANVLALVIAAALALSACRQNARPNDGGGGTASTQAPASTVAPEALTFHTGRNDYTVNVDGFPREFIVYVPATYDASQPAPLVFMFHGTNQGGPLMYENTRWVEEADANNIIVVFPTSWKYPLIGETGTHTKWNDIRMESLAEPGTEFRDDVHFVRVMLNLTQAAFNVDAQRIYATGFSNGGSFVSSRLIPQMYDVFAAYAICGSGISAANGDVVTNFPAGITASLYAIVGTNDEKISEGTGFPRPFPLDPAGILAHEIFGPTLTNTAGMLSLDPSQYQLIGSDPNYTIFLFNQSTLGADNEYIFQMVDGMGHVYPSVDNNRHQLNAANIFWEFFMRHPME